MSQCTNKTSQNHTVILGGGLSGLATGFMLSAAGKKVSVLESGNNVGGLSQTVSHNGFLFDLGGHRFLTKKKELEQFVLALLKDDVLDVPRKSKIYMRRKYFDYPLKPLNATFGLGLGITCEILWDYFAQRVNNFFHDKELVSLEDWVVHRFGRKMFDLYFKEYTEKVWGLECDQISMEWVAQRIDGLSLGKAIKNAFFKFSGRDIPTLTDRFYYPLLGIGEISDRMKESIEIINSVETKTRVTKIRHADNTIQSVVAVNSHTYEQHGSEFVSSIPLTSLVKMLDPGPPQEIIDACNQLKFRDLVIVTLMLNRERITDLTWMYLPEKDIPLGRIHEPKNWSPHMSPKGKTSIVAEYFCFAGDKIWGATDEELRDITAENLIQLNFIRKEDVLDFCVIRAKNAYPIFEIGYQAHYEKILDYLSTFSNLHLVGRGGKFKYYNMDHALESGIETARNILKNAPIQ
ncbi:MAG: FAD-dependent oxidoreductase [Proteobacteria bacterium]|nr:FAD-dependent oxidoreductase [Pseudomonadota bacterium]MBU1708433.1 FAD-dependent oxidoreductase [Pseudomonadota bacterium]